MSETSEFVRRREVLRDGLSHPRALAALTELLERERLDAKYRPGCDLATFAWHAGRTAVLEELVAQLKQLNKE